MFFKKLFRKNPNNKTYHIPGLSVVDRGSKLENLLFSMEYATNRSVALLGEFGGERCYIDIEKTPHILVAGSPGSGKSVCINTMISSLLLKNSPYELELYICDPKRVDYIKYKNLPFLKAYETETEGIIKLFHNLIDCMEYRFKVLQSEGVSHNKELKKPFPVKLVVFDEFASLMDKRGKKELLPLVEHLARLSRAVNIHMILATQRPDSSVISGQLKANVLTRICFRVPSAMDSRIILDMKGGETLRGCGDGLLLDSGGYLKRFQCFMIPDNERTVILDHWKKQN